VYPTISKSLTSSEASYDVQKTPLTTQYLHPYGAIRNGGAKQAAGDGPGQDTHGAIRAQNGLYFP
jgi:hypothetical protein